MDTNRVPNAAGVTRTPPNRAAGSPPRRYFAASVLLGRLHVPGMIGREGWNAARLVYLNEEHLRIVLEPRLGDRKIENAAGLEAALLESVESKPLFAKVWVREGLEEAARRHWEIWHARKGPVTLAA
jgi:hypothetical protein